MDVAGNPGQEPQRMRANRRVIANPCTTCGTAFQLLDEVYPCATCGGHHHAACWEPSNACSRSAPQSATAAPTVVLPVAPGGTPLTCPACGLVSPASAMRCDCGHRFTPEAASPLPLDPTPPLDDERACPKCGKHIKREALKCRFCGHALDSRLIADLHDVPAEVTAEIEKKASAALRDSIIGFFFCAPIFAPRAITHARETRALLRQHPGYAQKSSAGRKAGAALIIAWAGLAFFVIAFGSRLVSS